MLVPVTVKRVGAKKVWRHYCVKQKALEAYCVRVLVDMLSLMLHLCGSWIVPVPEILRHFSDVCALMCCQLSEYYICCSQSKRLLVLTLVLFMALHLQYMTLEKALP